ncbi:MAG: hypothetical protein RLZZ03_111 [Pseudomonadota bacterium]
MAMNQHKPANLSLGVTVMPEWFQCEGIDAVLDRLQALGANALVTSPYLLEIVADGQGAREPPPDGDAGIVRPLDRALWGRRETWVRTAPSLVHDLSRYKGLRYQPGPPGALTLAQPDLMDRVINAARGRGMSVFLQVMAASPPGYRVQFSGAQTEDQCLGPDGQLHPQRVDRNASLASPHVQAYGAALLAELADRYPGVNGLRIDWPEYPPYDLRSVLFDFSLHARAALRAQGVEPLAYSELVMQYLRRWREVAQSAAPLGVQAVREQLRKAGWDDFFGERGDGQALWASKRASVGTMLRTYRAALDQLPGPRRSLQPQVFPHPWSNWSGFAWDALGETADAVGVKLYTMHWPMMARYWARDLIGPTPDPELDAVTGAMADFLGLCDTTPPNGAAMHYPGPETAHPVGAKRQQEKLAQAQTQAGKVSVVAFTHSYGPLEDVVARVDLALQSSLQPGGSGQVWINRYGYLSDAKLAALAPLVQQARAAAHRAVT